MIRKLSLAFITFAALTGSSAGFAKQYVEYSPEKGVWEINAIEVDPNHVDDYLVGLRKSQVPGFEIMKKHGIIDDYHFVVRNGYSKGSPNVLIQVHYTSMAMLDPNKARDQMIEKEIEATFSDADGKVAVAGYEKIRTFVDDGLSTEMTFTK